MNIGLLQQQSVFIVGFAIGFVTFFFSEYANRVFEAPAYRKGSSKGVWNLVENWLKAAENYQAWQQNQGIRSLKADLDAIIYGTRFDEFSGEKI